MIVWNFPVMIGRNRHNCPYSYKRQVDSVKLQSMSANRRNKTNKMISLIFLCVGLTQAVTPENIKIIQQQSAFTAEASLSRSMIRCLLK